MPANVSLATVYALGCAILSFGTYRLYLYYKALIDCNSELSAYWANRSPRFLAFMKWFIPLMLLGFVLNILNSAVALLLIVLKMN